MSYRLVVGLGNPGSEYANTRHNLGYRVIDAFARKRGSAEWRRERRLKGEMTALAGGDGETLHLLKPTTYMNESGVAVQKACSYYKIPPEQVVVIYDEINLPAGELKLSLQGSAGGHNGLESVLSVLPPRFARLRIGIGNKPFPEMDLADYVLGKPTPEEETLISSSLDRFVDSLERLLREGPERAMNHINRKQKTDDSNSI